MLNYLKENGQISLADVPLNDADWLIFAQLAYLDFAGARSGVLLREAVAHAAVQESSHETEERFPFQKRDDQRLCRLLMGAKRYESIRFEAFASIYNPEEETQFAVLILTMLPNVRMVIFRGTDNTLAGWKEDFNLAFMPQVPAQALALEWAARAAEETDQLILAGHSKGGHLALYAAVGLEEAVQRKLRWAISLDGPGLTKEQVQSAGYARVADKLRLIRPQASLIGQLFYAPASVRVVKSRTISLLQHYPYTWKTQGMDLASAQRPYPGEKLLGEILTEMVDQLPEDVREKFVEAVYGIISQAPAETFTQMLDSWLESAKAIARKLFSTDKETAKLFAKVLSAFLKAAYETLKNTIDPGDDESCTNA